MKQFISIISKVFIAIFLFICSIFFLVDGYDDPYYLKFTSAKKKSLIIGDSRSAFGIKPSIINSKLSRNDVYNFSFDIQTSPYGEIYYEKIKDFLDPSNDGLFIVSVTPYSLSNYDPMNVDKRFDYGKREHARSLKYTPLNLRINFIYLLKYYKNKYHSILTNKSRSLLLHSDGWLENKSDLNEIKIKKQH